MVFKFRDFARCCFMGSERAPASSSAAARITAVLSSPVQLLPDDLLREILLRLPPLPSSVPRASLVCRRWRRLVADPFFLRRFRQRHRTPPPLLGYFFSDTRGPVFVPTLASPNCVPPERFSLPRQPSAAGERLFLLGCRHGLALLINRRRLHALVWDPATGCRATVAYPPEFTTDNGAYCCRGTVLSTAATDDDVHLMMRPFKVILIRTDNVNSGLIRVSMCVYESNTGKWGHAISVSTVIPMSVSNLPSVLIGNAARLCGFLRWPKGILEFDLERHSLGVVQTPKSLRHAIDTSFFQVVRTQDGELGLAVLSSSRLSMELWGRNKAAMAANSPSSDGLLGWVLQKTIQLDNLLPVPRMNMMDTSSNLTAAMILGFDEDNDAIHVSTFTGGAFVIRLDSMQITELFNVNLIGSYQSCHPYTGVYTAGVTPLPPA